MGLRRSRMALRILGHGTFVNESKKLKNQHTRKLSLYKFSFYVTFRKNRFVYKISMRNLHIFVLFSKPPPISYKRRELRFDFLHSFFIRRPSTHRFLQRSLSLSQSEVNWLNLVFKMLKLWLLLLPMLAVSAFPSRKHDPPLPAPSDSNFNQASHGTLLADPDLNVLTSDVDDPWITQEGNDLIVMKSGQIEVLLKDGSLKFGICNDGKIEGT